MTARLVAGRLVAGIAVVWAAATIAFLALRAVPGDPVDAVLGPTGTVSPQLRETVAAEYGFDRPLIAQYAHWLGSLVTGDLGRSYQLGQPVGTALAGQAWPTVQLALAAGVLAVLLGLTLAVSTAGRGRWAGRVASGLELAAVSTPSFWLGLVALMLFSFQLRLLPVAGGNGPAALVLPAATLALPLAGLVGRLLREGLEDALDRPWAVSVRARGVRRSWLVWRHALRHAATTLSTVTGWVIGSLLGGAVLTETVFARPGLGRVLMSAVTSRDIPVVGALVVVSAVVFTLVNLLVDLTYRAIDPRLVQEAPA